MIKYVVGFCFTTDRSRVVLIRKTHPEWQAGKLNGVGGHIEAGESVYQTMKREFKEETGVVFQAIAWDHKFTIINREIGYELNVMYCFNDLAYEARSMTDEKVVLVSIDYLLGYYPHEYISNIRWIIPLLLDRDIRCGFVMEGNR